MDDPSTDPRREIHLGALLHTGGQHGAAWRHPEGCSDAGQNFAHFQELARIAEDGKFDFAFLADTLGLRDWPMDVIVRSAHGSLLFEPMTLMSALAAGTTHLGFGITASTTYSHPFTVARQFAGLDLLSGGRVAWNVVTSTQNSEVGNHGIGELLPHEERYERATEFVEVVDGLWGTSDPGVFLGDAQRGQVFDPEKIRVYNHHGRNFQVDGVLNVPPSPQGRPVIIQAGASAPGRALAASVADVIFALTPTFEAASSYYHSLRGLIGESGRDPDSVRILPGFIPVIGSSRAEAMEKIAELDALIPVEVSLATLSDLLGDVDLSGYDLDGPLPDTVENNAKSKTMVDTIKSVAGREQLSIRELAAWLVGTFGHVRVPGTPEEIADTMQHWFEDGACDGFLISPSIYPKGLREFVDEVVPILQERDLFRQEYESDTLRGNLGLPDYSGNALLGNKRTPVA